MELEGEVISIIYKNDVNSYTIAEFETEDDMLTIVGYLPFISIGDSLKIIGKFVEHKSYGRQFKIDTFEKLMPKTLGALERYLANGNIKGVGEKLAKRIINKFGDETMKCEVCHKNEAIKETAYILSKVVLVNVCQACNEELENMYHILSTRYEIRREGEVK